MTATPATSTTPNTPSEATSVGTGANQVIFEAPPVAVETPTVAVSTSPVVAEPYKISELQNGQFEITMDSGQIFKGTQSQIMSEMAKSIHNGTRTIATLNGKTPPITEPAPTIVQPGEIDPTALAITDLVAQGLDFQGGAKELKEFVSIIPMLREFVQQQQLNNVASAFLAATPDFPHSDVNAGKIDAALIQYGLPATVEALQLVHNHLKATGQYERVAVAAQNGTRPLPTPPNGFSEIPQEQDPWSMPLDKLAETIRRGN